MDNRIVPLWLDGRKFESRVQVWCGEKYLYRAHEDEAFKLCISGSAKPDSDSKKIHKIILVRTPSDKDRKGPPKAMTPYSYAAGQRLINKEMMVGERCIPFQSFSYKKLQESDRWAYIKSQTDCICPWPADLRPEA